MLKSQGELMAHERGNTSSHKNTEVKYLRLVSRAMIGSGALPTVLSGSPTSHGSCPEFLRDFKPRLVGSLK